MLLLTTYIVSCPCVHKINMCGASGGRTVLVVSSKEVGGSLAHRTGRKPSMSMARCTSWTAENTTMTTPQIPLNSQTYQSNLLESDFISYLKF